MSSSVTSEGGAPSPGGVGGVMGISSKPTQWYYHLCNRWLSLLGVSILPRALSNRCPLLKIFSRSHYLGVETESICVYFGNIISINGYHKFVDSKVSVFCVSGRSEVGHDAVCALGLRFGHTARHAAHLRVHWPGSAGGTSWHRY